MMGHVGFGETIMMTVIWLGMMLAVPAAIWYFARRLLRALERRPVTESQLAETADRLRRLEERVEELASENERLVESQRFTTQLLGEQGRTPPR